MVASALAVGSTDRVVPAKGNGGEGRKEKLVIGFCRGREERYRHKGKRRGEDPFFPWPIFLRESRVQQRGLFLLAVCAREMKFAPLDRFVFFSLGSNMVFFLLKQNLEIALNGGKYEMSPCKTFLPKMVRTLEHCLQTLFKLLLSFSPFNKIEGGIKRASPSFFRRRCRRSHPGNM